MPATKRLVVELPEEQHKAIKAKALLRGVSMRDYVLEKLRVDQRSGDEYDLDDVTDSIAEALQEVVQYKGGKKDLQSARDFFGKDKS